MRTLILLALIGAAFAVPQKIQRIVGGSNTNVQTYPYISNLEYSGWWGTWSQACGGSLITTNSVLSAAHCFFGDSASTWRVRLGTSLRSSGGTVYTLSSIIMHPQYNNNQLNNDIAILRLSSNAALSNSVALAGVAGANYNLADNTVVTTIGWGALWTGGPASEQLQHVDINIINQQVCVDRYNYLRTLPGYQNWPVITADMLCAGILNVGGRDACQGDSGGPLAHNRNTLVGVVSWGYQCAHSYWPGVNSRVSHNINWIVSNT